MRSPQRRLGASSLLRRSMRRRACHRSKLCCMASQLSGLRPSAIDRRSANSGLTARSRRTTRASVEGGTSSRDANRRTLTSSGARYSVEMNSPGCGGLCMAINGSPRSRDPGHRGSEPEGQPPVSAHSDRPVSEPIALQRVQAIARHMEVVDRASRLERSELRAQFDSMVSADSGCISGLEEYSRALCVESTLSR